MDSSTKTAFKKSATNGLATKQFGLRRPERFDDDIFRTIVFCLNVVLSSRHDSQNHNWNVQVDTLQNAAAQLQMEVTLSFTQEFFAGIIMICTNKYLR